MARMPFAVSSLTGERRSLKHPNSSTAKNNPAVVAATGTTLYQNGTGVFIPILRCPDRQNNASPPTELKMDWIHSFCARKTSTIRGFKQHWIRSWLAICTLADFASANSHMHHHPSSEQDPDLPPSQHQYSNKPVYGPQIQCRKSLKAPYGQP